MWTVPVWVAAGSTYHCLGARHPVCMLDVRKSGLCALGITLGGRWTQQTCSVLERGTKSTVWAGLWVRPREHELHARSSVSMAVGGQLVQAHLARRSLLSCSDEVALSHKELCFHSPCIRASGAKLRPAAHHVRHRAP